MATHNVETEVLIYGSHMRRGNNRFITDANSTFSLLTQFKSGVKFASHTSYRDHIDLFKQTQPPR